MELWRAAKAWRTRRRSTYWAAKRRPMLNMESERLEDARKRTTAPNLGRRSYILASGFTSAEEISELAVKRKSFSVQLKSC